MSKMAICDQCNKHEPLSPSYATVPDTWYTLRQAYKEEWHLCSLGCLMERVAALMKDAAAIIASAVSTTVGTSTLPS